MVETIQYLLTSQVEIERIWSEEAALDRADDDNDGQAETDVWSDIITEATDECGFYLEMWYDPADYVNNAWCRRAASVCGAFFLSQRRGMEAQYVSRYERIIAKLEAIAAGRLQIPRLPQRADLTPSMSNYSVSNQYAVSKIRVQPSISTGGTSSRQNLDQSLIWEPF